MKNSIWSILLYITLLVAIVFFEYESNNIDKTDISIRKYKTEQNRDLEEFILSYIKPLNNTTIHNEQWGIIIQKSKEKTEGTTTNFTEIKVEKKKFCIKSSCYELLGISQDREKKIILYNKKLKPKIKVFFVNDILENRVQIVDIDSYAVSLHELNSSKNWQLKMFDINLTKYKPKEIE